ncbi:FkbM family methyltransferase [Paraburkholderia sp. DHOC27]|nr:FkbM family methyltransferase [Paraburkholderia sp. DHOC27]
MLANPNDFYLGRAVVEYGEYGEIESQFLGQLFIRPGAIVEVGANSGTHTIALATRARQEHRPVFAFEPQPFLFQNLCANLALNGLTHVRAWPAACGANAGTLYFDAPDYLSQGNFGGVSMTPTSGQKSIAVSCVRLDDALANETIGLLKVDVEGAELDVLQGCREILKRSQPVLYVENDRVGQSRALIEWLWSQGYRLWWHLPPLFNPRNHFGSQENLYGNAVSCNMLCLPQGMNITVEALTDITDATLHPFVRQASFGISPV